MENKFYYSLTFKDTAHAIAVLKEIDATLKGQNR